MTPEQLFAPGTRHRFLSPHYDDIALSAGGLATLLARRGLPVSVEVIFGEEPEAGAPLTAFADELHAAWGMSADEVISGRRAEEAAAARVIGAVSRTLPFRDCIYRGEQYLSNEDLFGAPKEAEAALPEDLIAALGLPGRPDPDLWLYAPLAVGRHVDHQHAFNAGVALARRGWNVLFYEDLPYGLLPGGRDRRLANLPAAVALEPAAIVPVDGAWAAKIDAIFAYPSQLETIFSHYVGVGHTRDKVDAAMREYAGQYAPGQLSERYWRLAD
ncbi:MAG: PIG-L deacetylase family protein [Chloroflexota bacterium]